MPSISELKKSLDALLEKFRSGKRKGLVLTLLAVARLAERGEEIRGETVEKEAKKIMSEHPGVDWGVKKDEYTVGLASDLLRELAEMGVLEPVGPWENELSRRYKLSSYKDGDPLEEIYSRFGYLIFYGGPSR